VVNNSFLLTISVAMKILVFLSVISIVTYLSLLAIKTTIQVHTLPNMCFYPLVGRNGTHEIGIEMNKNITKNP